MTAGTLAHIKGRCRIEGDHWIWTGAQSEGYPRIYAPDYTKGGKLSSQPGRRAVWHVVNKKPLPNGWRVFGCEVELCVSPKCVFARDPAERGQEIAQSGVWKGNVKRILANRLSGQRRSILSPDLIHKIVTSPKTGAALERELGIRRQIISRIRTGRANAFTPVGGLFTGLLVAAGSEAQCAA